MARARTWTDAQLIEAVKTSGSIRQVLQKLGLVEAGGNYVQTKAHIEQLQLSFDNYHGRGRNKGLLFKPRPVAPLSSLLIQHSRVQSFKLKKRLFTEHLKNLLVNYAPGQNGH